MRRKRVKTRGLPGAEEVPGGGAEEADRGRHEDRAGGEDLGRVGRVGHVELRERRVPGEGHRPTSFSGVKRVSGHYATMCLCAFVDPIFWLK